MRSTRAIGSATVSPAQATSSTRCTAAVIGTTSCVSVPRPRSVANSTAPPSDSSVALTASIPTPRPEISVTVSAVESPGRKASAASCSGERSAARSGCTMPASAPRGLEVHAGAVVGDADPDRILLAPRVDADAPGLGLAGRDARLGLLDAVVDGVADQVHQRIGEAIEDRAVELELAARDLHLRLLAQALGDVARRARERLQDAQQRGGP